MKKLHVVIIVAAALVLATGTAGVVLWLGDGDERRLGVLRNMRPTGTGSSEAAASSSSDAFDGQPGAETEGGGAGEEGGGSLTGGEPVEQSLWAYVWANDPSAASYTPATRWQRNSTGALNTIVRTGTGAYTVTLPNLGVYGGTVNVTSYGVTSELCKVRNWYPTPDDLKVRVLCFTASGSAADARFVLSYAGPVGGTDWAYVWANLPSGAPGSVYVPNTIYQDNATGHTNTVTPTTTAGRYSVRLPGLGGSGGAVKVTAYGSGNEVCNVGSWQQNGPDEWVVVVCSTPGGAPVDALFTMTFHRSDGMLGVLPETGAERAFVWAHQPSVASYTPTLLYQFNSAGGANTITRSSTGVYQVRLPSLGVERGHVQVTAYASVDARCKVASWTSNGVDELVNVRCFDASGAPLDAKFVMTFVD